MFKNNKITSPAYFLIDICLIILSFWTAYSLRIAKGESLAYCEEYFLGFLFWGLVLLYELKRKKLFVTDRSLSIPSELARVFTAVTRSCILVGTFIFVFKYEFFSRIVFCFSYLFCIFVLGAWRLFKRLFVRYLISEGYQNTKVLIVGTGRSAKVANEEILRHPYFGLKLCGFLGEANKYIFGEQLLGNYDNFESVIKKYFIDEVIISDSTQDERITKLIEKAKCLRLGVRVIPADFEHSYPILDVSYLGIVPLLTYKERRHHPAEFALKRIFDIFSSLFLIFFCSPLYIIFALLIKFESRGPVFFKQDRVGFKGRIFNFYKFRSMVVNAEELKESLKAQNEVKDGVIFKIKDDPRITKVGRFIRKYSIDELPQLINVLLGDMSLVGPRPPVPSEVKEYDSEQMERLSIRPGITGMSQVKGRSELSFRNWVRWDIWYINNWSFGLDLMILLWTVPAVIKGKGAY